MSIGRCLGACLIAGLCLDLPPRAVSQSSVTFDFDTGTPALTTGQAIPFAQSSVGITANFSSPSGPSYSVQSDTTTGWRMSRFSGRYLYDNDLTRSVLTIRFSRPLSAISLTFATADFQIEVPSNVQLTAYLDSNATPAIGSATAHGAYLGDTMPTGTLSFLSAARPFNLVEITVPFQVGGATTFFADNIVVVPFAAITSVSAASYAVGAPLAQESIASGFGHGLASGTEGATVQPPPTTLANTTVRVRDALGTERLAPLYYVGPAQINYYIPDGTAVGAATVTVTSAGQVTASADLTITAVAPGFFTANMDGRGAPAAWAIAVAPDQTQTFAAVIQCGLAVGSCVTAPINLGPAGTQVFVSLYGTGIRGRSSPSAVTATVGGVNAEVQYAGPQAQLVGMDQVNILIPRSLAGRGEVDLIVTVDGQLANTVRVNIQ
jgi:uncharacterized protein (TIGR03437 family)